MNSIIDETNRSIILENITVLVPVKKFKIDFDFTTKSTVPAILETAINLIGCLEEISDNELKLYFGLNFKEKEVLIEDLLKSDYININNEGILEPSAKYDNAQKTIHNRILLDEVENHFGNLLIDTSTLSIQAVSDENINTYKGVKILDTEIKDVNANEIFVEQFQRYKDASKRFSLQSNISRLYRINRCEYERLHYIPVSVNFFLKFSDDNSKPIIDFDLQDPSTVDSRLIRSSQLMLKVVEFLTKRQLPNITTSIYDYINYFENNFLDLYLVKEEFYKENFFKDILDNKLIGNNDDKFILGSIYLQKNQEIFMKFISDINFSLEGNKKPILWRPSNDEFWGCSKQLKTFTDDIEKNLNEFGIELALCLPNISFNDKKDYYFQFRNFINNVYLIDYSRQSATNSLSEVEFMIFDGVDKFAFIQYSFYGDSILGGIPLRLGYLTKDLKKIEKVKKIFLACNSNFSTVTRILPKNDDDRKYTYLESFFNQRL